MKIKRVYFQIKVSDLNRAKNFYNDVFDFEVAWFMDTDVGWCEMQLPNDARLGLNTREPGQDIIPSWGILTLDVENLEESRAYLDKKGLKPTEIVDIPDMVSIFDVYDTEGNKIQIIGEPRVKSEKK
jgi:predicted enzyme related to lactoylglutathione lyase